MTRNSISQKGNLDRETITDLVGLHSDRRDWHFDLWIYIPARFESRNLSTRISSASFEDHRRISIRRPQQVAIPSGPLLFLDVLRHGLWNDVALCEDSKLSAMGIFPDNTTKAPEEEKVSKVENKKIMKKMKKEKQEAKTANHPIVWIIEPGYFKGDHTLHWIASSCKQPPVESCKQPPVESIDVTKS
jgi:hypothetical protein